MQTLVVQGWNMRMEVAGIRICVFLVRGDIVTEKPDATRAQLVRKEADDGSDAHAKPVLVHVSGMCVDRKCCLCSDFQSVPPAFMNLRIGDAERREWCEGCQRMISPKPLIPHILSHSLSLSMYTTSCSAHRQTDRFLLLRLLLGRETRVHSLIRSLNLMSQQQQKEDREK
jgi:hypothetical protein